MLKKVNVIFYNGTKDFLDVGKKEMIICINDRKKRSGNCAESLTFELLDDVVNEFPRLIKYGKCKNLAESFKNLV